MVHRLPADLRAAVDAFDPERAGSGSPRRSSPPTSRRRPAGHRRPARVVPGPRGQAAGGRRLGRRRRRAGAVPHRRPGRRAALDAATAELGTELGAVWSGDARGGFNGGGNFVRWLRDDRDRAAAAAFFRPRCDRVRVLPFLEGVPCSIHGFVLPDGTAVLRPVEIVTLRDPAARTMAYCGLGSTWDPPAGDREAMRGAARRVGAHLQRDARLPRRVRHRRRADRRRVPAHRAQHPDVGRRHGAERGRPAVLHVPAGGARGRHGPGAHRGGRRGAGAGDGRRPRRQGRRLRRGHGGGAPGELPGHLGRPGVRAHRGGDREPVPGRLRPERAVRQGGPVRRGRARASGWRRSTPPSCASSTRRTAPRSGRWSPRPTFVRRPDVARVVVVGGGFGGLATAARLAKLGHDVTVLERLDTLGGAVSTVSADGFEWDAGPTSTLLPAVIRDLFRKSGRPVERELELEPLDLVREHWFEDGTVLGLPGHSRAAQLRAVDELEPGLGRLWVDYVDSFSEDWEVLRRAYFENAVEPRGPLPRGGGAVRRPRDAAQAAEEDLQGRAAAAGGRHTRSSRTGTSRGTCRPGPAWSPTWSSGSARGRSPAGWRRSPRR